MSKKFIIFHGRFQPFHNGHKAILQILIQNTSYEIIIGIVNPDPWEIWPGDRADQYRFSPEKNPLTYWERCITISEVVKSVDTSNRVTAIVPLPRPSININQARRFAPVSEAIFAFTLRYGDELEEAKVELTKDAGGEVFFILEDELPPEVVPITSTLIRDLIVLGDSTWKLFVPAETHDLFYKLNLMKSFALNIEPNKALENMIRYIASNPYKDWCRTYLEAYMREAKKDVNNTGHKRDIIGAIAESVCGVFPLLKGLLRLRDQDRQHKIEESILDEVRTSNANTQNEIAKILSKHQSNLYLINDKAFNHLLTNAILEFTYKNTIDSSFILSELSTQSSEFADRWKYYSDHEYFKALVDCYDTNVEDLWILLKDYDFDVSQIKGSTTRAKIRSFMQSLKHTPPIKVFRIIKAIHQEHEGERAFKEAYLLAKAFLPTDLETSGASPAPRRWTGDHFPRGRDSYLPCPLHARRRNEPLPVRLFWRSNTPLLLLAQPGAKIPRKDLRPHPRPNQPPDLSYYFRLRFEAAV